MPSFPERTLDDIVSTLRDAKSRKRGASLLIGAGCSVSAGIPLATQFVDEIARESAAPEAGAAPQDGPQESGCLEETSYVL